MSDSTKPYEQPAVPPSYAASSSPVHGVLGEFDDVTALTRACEKVRDQGFTRWDAHTPFPVHGLDAAMGIKPTKLPWLVLGAGLTGLSLALLMQCWMNGIDYKFIISGKPLFSIPAFIPVTFELTVLFSALTTFFGALALNNLPELFHPLHLSARFRRATNDRFFVYIEAADPLFDADKAQSLLQGLHAIDVETVRYEQQGRHTHLPTGTLGITMIVAALSLVPLAMFARARERTSPKPRIHANPPAPIKDDMDHQYKFKPQAENWFFADQRAARAWVPGAVAVEDAVVQTPFLTGRTVQAAPVEPPQSSSRDASRTQKAQAGAALEHPTVAQAAPEAPYLTQIPAEVELTEATIKRGQQRFNIYCSTCHGISGHGDGMVARHAEALQEGTWVAPSSLHDDRVRHLAVGDLYNTISHGVRNMPAYGHLIEPNDRWLIVAYVKALQRSLYSPVSDVPQDARPGLQ